MSRDGGRRSLCIGSSCMYLLVDLFQQFGKKELREMFALPYADIFGLHLPGGFSRKGMLLSSKC